MKATRIDYETAMRLDRQLLTNEQADAVDMVISSYTASMHVNAHWFKTLEEARANQQTEA